MSSISAPELASVSSMVFDSNSRCARRFWRLDQLAAIVAGVAGEIGQAGFDPVDAGLDQAGRMGDALGLAVDHADDLADFADRVADLAEAGLGGAAALDAGLDLGGDGAGLAGQLADGRARSGWSPSACRGRASSPRRRRPRSCGRRPRRGRPRWWHSSASMLVLRAIVSMVEETVWTWFIADAKPAMRSPSWTTSSVSPLKPAMVPSIASRPASSLALACSDSSRASSVESLTPRLVGEQPRGHFLEPVEHLQMLADLLGDAFDIAGDVAALDRQRAAIARNRADRILGDFLDPLCGHESPLPHSTYERGIERTSYSFVNQAGGGGSIG